MIIVYAPANDRAPRFDLFPSNSSREPEILQMCEENKFINAIFDIK